MQVALTVWQDRISPLFDAASRLLIVKVEENRILARQWMPFECRSVLFGAARLNNLGVQVLICGGISDFSEKLIAAHGIRVFSFISGRFETVLESYLAGRLEQTHCLMEGENFS